MSYSLHRINFQGENIIERIEANEITVVETLTRKINLFFNITSNLYYQKQIGKKGIRNLGDKLRHDDHLKQLFIPDSNHYLVKSTGNRMSFLKIFLESITEVKTENIYFLIFTKNLNRVSQIFDKTTTNILDIEQQLSTLKKFCGNMDNNKNIFIIEISEFPDHKFILTDENYSRIYPR